MGSICFVINGFFTFLPSTIFANETTTTFNVTIDIAALTYAIGGFMALFAGFKTSPNVTGDVDALEDVSTHVQVQAYRPALLGSKEWIRFSSFSDLRTFYLPNAVFKTGLLQLVSGLVFTISAVAGFLGVIDFTNPENEIYIQAFIEFPLVLGGAHFWLQGAYSWSYNRANGRY